MNSCPLLGLRPNLCGVFLKEKVPKLPMLIFFVWFSTRNSKKVSKILELFFFDRSNFCDMFFDRFFFVTVKD